MKSLAFNFRNCVRCIVPLYFSFPALLCALCSEPPKRVYIMNFPRSFTPEASHYSLIEQLKDGYISSYMYGEMKDLFFRRPLVAVFANSPPDVSKLSPDRWRIYKIGRRQVPGKDIWQSFLQRIPVEDVKDLTSTTVARPLSPKTSRGARRAAQAAL